MQRAADDQGHRDGVGIHDQHMLKPKREQLWQRQYLVDGVNGLAHRKAPKLQIVWATARAACKFRA
jgi:hypothetical protein